MQTTAFDRNRVNSLVPAPLAQDSGAMIETPKAGPPLHRFAGRGFVVAFMVAKRDWMLLWDLLGWMRELERRRIDCEVVVVCEHILDGALRDALRQQIHRTFTGPVHVHRAPFQMHDETWPKGPDWLFACTAEWCHRHERDFLLLEPDITVLKPGWCDTIRRAYYGAGKPFMGTQEEAGSAHPQHMPGNGVYPWTTHQYATMNRLEIPFDVWLAEQGVMRDGLVTVTPLIQQVWSVRDWHERHGKNGQIPLPSRQPGTVLAALTFPDWEIVAEVVDPAALIFHRCKDGSLIQRLRERRKLT